MADQQDNNLQNRKGIVDLNLDYLRQASEQVLKELFSNFFPFATEPLHGPKFYNSVRYYGLCPYFEVVEPGTAIPDYELEFEFAEDETVTFVGVKKLQS